MAKRNGSALVRTRFAVKYRSDLKCDAAGRGGVNVGVGAGPSKWATHGGEREVKQKPGKRINEWQ